MSLIDEALKRAELEAARRDGLRGGGAYPWVPEHMPKKGRRWVAVTVALIGAGVVGGGALWVSRRPEPGGREGAGVRSPEARARMTPSQRLETVEVPPPQAGLPSRVATRGDEEASSKPGKETRRPTAPFDTARARIAPPSSGASTESKTAGGPADARTYVGEVVLPDGVKIELGGIVFSETSPVALINGKVLPAGGVVEEFTIVSIKEDRVELKGRGVTIFLVLK